MAERGFGTGQRDKILRTFWARNRGHNAAHIQAQGVGVNRRIPRVAPEPVFLGIGLNQRNTGLIPAGGAQIAQGFAINGKKAASGAIFRGHIGDGGPVGQRQHVQPASVKLDKFTHHALFAQHFDDFQHKVGAGGAFDHRAGQLKPNDLWDQHGNWLTEHRGLCLNPTNAPAQYGQTIDHGGMAVGADKRVRIGDLFPVLVPVGPHGLCEIFQIHLMANPGAGGHNTEIVKGGLPPFQELIPLHIAFIFAVHIHLKRARIAKFVDHDRVVNDQIHGIERVDQLRVASQRFDAVPHRGKVNNGRNPGEILHQHAGRTIGDFARVFPAVFGPIGKGFDVVHTDRSPAIFKAQHVFQHHLKGRGQA